MRIWQIYLPIFSLVFADRPAPKIRLNLYEPPETRWVTAWESLPDIQKLNNCRALGNILYNYIYSNSEANTLITLIDLLVPRVEHSLPDEYLAETNSVVSHYINWCNGNGVPLKLTKNLGILVNLLYEISSFDNLLISDQKWKEAAAIKSQLESDQLTLAEIKQKLKNLDLFLGQNFASFSNFEYEASKFYAKEFQFFETLILGYFFEKDSQFFTIGNKACTSIMAHNSKLNQNFAARNMDFLPANFLKKLTVDLDIYKSETDTQPWVQATTFFGYVGFWTNFKNGKLSIDMNQRTVSSLLGNIFHLLWAHKQNTERKFGKNQYWPVAFLARKAAEECGDYDCAFYRMAGLQNSSQRLNLNMWSKKFSSAPQFFYPF